MTSFVFRGVKIKVNAEQTMFAAVMSDGTQLVADNKNLIMQLVTAEVTRLNR